MTHANEDVLKDYRRWLYKVAQGLAQDSHTQEDLVQEGWVYMWKALSTFDPTKGALPSWITKAALLRMTDVARRGKYTGKPSRVGKKGTAEQFPQPADPTWGWMDVVKAPDLIDSVMLAYHQGEIVEAINELSPEDREYVVRRFWKGETSTSADRTAWVRRIRPALKERLEHLAEV